MPSRTLVRLSSFAIQVVLASSAFQIGFAQSATLDSEQWAFLSLINAFRAQNGAGPLQVSVSLQTSSQWMSVDMAAKNYFSHTDSLGRSAGARIASFGYHFFPWGENIAAGNSGAQNTFNQWLTACDPNASGACTFAHRQNMLDPSFAAIGIGRAFQANSAYGWYWTTDFGGVVDQAVTPGPTNPPPISAPVITSFRATPSTMTAGQSSALTWSVSGATSISINNGIGDVTNLTSRAVSPGQTITYTLTATNLGGSSTASATVTVNAPAGDSQPPTAPVITSAVATGSTQIELKWSASTDNVGVVGYQIFRNGSVWTTTGGGTLAIADTGVSAGTTYVYAIKAFDGAGHLSGASNSALVTTPPPAPGPATCPAPASAAFTGCYYNNITLSGPPALVKTDGQINLDGSPGPAISPASFSARWQGYFDFTQGEYIFSAIVSDGMRLYVDGVLALDAWRDQSTTSYTAIRTLSQGQHLLTVEYFQRSGVTSAHLSWQRNDTRSGRGQPSPPAGDSQPPSAPALTSVMAKSSTRVDLAWTASTDNTGVAGYQVFRNGSLLTSVAAPGYTDTGVGANSIYTYFVKAIDAAGNVSPASNNVQVATPGSPEPPPEPVPASCGPPAHHAFTGCYYDNATLTGNPALTRVDSLVNFDWGMRAPDSSIPSSSYSVRWQGSFHFAQGDYLFTAIASDGMRVYIDGVLMLDAWRNQPPTVYTFSQSLSQGDHLIVVEYYRQSGSASAHLSWLGSDRSARR